jgi:hypothetical protein
MSTFSFGEGMYRDATHVQVPGLIVNKLGERTWLSIQGCTNSLGANSSVTAVRLVKLNLREEQSYGYAGARDHASSELRPYQLYVDNH